MLFVHGGLGDNRLWEPQATALADAFRCIRYDLRHFGRSDAPNGEFSFVDDAIALLDALSVDRAALVGLSLGGGAALDVAYAHPERVWALAHVAGAVTGKPVNPYSTEQDERFDAGDTGEKMAVDFEVWAPLGADDRLRELWRATPDARDGTDARLRPPPPVELEDVRVPTLIITARHDPPPFQEAAREAAHRIPGGTLVEVDSDHYLTLREPERVTELLRSFLEATRPR